MLKSMMKRLIAGLLCMVMLLGLLPPVRANAAASGAGIWNGTATATAFEGGTGTSSNPYQIATAAQLNYLAKLLKTNSPYSNDWKNYGTKYYKLTADLDMGGYPFIGIHYFNGSFDGNNHTISGLNISSQNSGTEDSNLGLFGIFEGGTIKNLTTKGSVYSSQMSGGIVAQIRKGTVSGCTNYCTVYSGYRAGGIAGCTVPTGTISITNCKNYGMVTGGTIGGIVGKIQEENKSLTNYTTVSKCANLATVQGKSYVGGIVGFATGGAIDYCANVGSISCTSGTYAGGIVAEMESDGNAGYYAKASIQNCYNAGSVTSVNTAGGIVPRIYGNFGSNQTVKSVLKNCYNAGTVKGSTAYHVGPVANDLVQTANLYYLSTINSSAKPTTATGLDATQMTQKSSFSGFTNSYWSVSTTADYKYPYITAIGLLPTACAHNWADATCQAPQTCTSCGTTQGSVGSHKFKNDTCTVCGLLGGSCGTSLTWTLDSAGNLVITGTGSIKDYNYGSSPFYKHADKITSVSLPDGLTSIGERAFDATFPNLDYIEIPTSVTHIQDCAFGATYDKVQLKYAGTMEQWNKIYIAEFVSYGQQYGAICSDGTIIYMGPCSGSNGLYDDVQYMLLGDGTLKITGSGAMTFYRYLNYESCFSSDDNITKVVIDEGVTSIAGYAFKNCENLTEIHIPTSVKTIDYDVFDGCTSLTDIYYGSSEKNWNQISISTTGNDPLKNATIHYTDPCASGHTWADANCVTPKTCSVCGETEGEADPTAHTWVAANCTYPKTCSTCNITEGEAIPTAHSFVNNTCEHCGLVGGQCGESAYWTLKDGMLTVYGIGAMADYTEWNQHAPWYDYASQIKAVRIEEGITYIGGKAFEKCENLTDVTIAQTVTQLGGACFSGCSSLTSIDLPNGITAIPGSAFSYSGLTGIRIPDGVTSIGSSAFAYCRSLVGIQIPEKVTSIGSNAFSNCDLLKVVRFTGSAPTIGSQCFSKIVITAIYPAGNTTWTADVRMHYGGTVTWVAYGQNHTKHSFDKNGVCSCGSIGGTCGQNAQWAMDPITGTLTISGTGKMTDYYDDSNTPWVSYKDVVRKVVVEEGITHVGDCAFKEFSNLEEISLPDSLKSIGYESIMLCKKLKGIEIPNGVMQIGAYAFEQCYALEAVVLPAGLSTISSGLFNTCTSLKTVTIPASVTSIGMSAFSGCSQLTDVYYGSNEKAWNKITVGSYNMPLLSATIHYTDPCLQGHTWIPADCVTPKTCSVCGETEGEALGHDWLGADCDTAKTCSVCGETEGEALGHDWLDANCTTPKTCDRCGETEGEALGHDWTPADCVTAKTCSVCGATEGEALGHTEEEIPAVPATCTATGLTAGVKCTVCKNVLKEQKVVAALGHTEAIDAAVPATCTETGLTEGKHCTVCGAVTVPQQIVTATGHKDLDQNYACDICGEDLCTDHVEELIPGKDATCTETGLTAGKKCALCGDIIAPQTVIPAMGHTPVADAAVEATCTKTGLTAGAHCVVCEVTIKAQQTIPAKGHTEVTDKAVAATCTTAGKTEGKHCSVCGAVTKAQQTVSVKGHTEVTDKAVAATCTTAGKTEGKHCSVCGAVTKAQQTVPAKGHTEVVDKAVAATCTTAGKTEGKHCSVCGAITKAQQTVVAKGHTEVTDKAVAATCTTAGKTEGKHCDLCGAVTKAQQSVAALGHNWKDATCTTPKTCKTCGATSGKAKGHDWAAGNCTTPKTCKVCGAKDGGVVHAYEHKYDYKCDLCGTTRPVDMTRPMVDMFRMYDPNSGEHFYTGSVEERENLVAVGWQYEGVGFTFPLTTGKPVHRLYDPITGEHLYTMDENEMNMLLDQGWNYEGIAFNSGFENEVPQYRLHNPNATRGAYHFTASLEERDMLISLGWEYQGIGWYSLGA